MSVSPKYWRRSEWPHDDVFDAQILEHVGGDLAGVGALFKEQVLGAHGDAQVLEGLQDGGECCRRGRR
jgi:hypothetical protein